MFKRAATELLSLRKDDVQSVLFTTARGKNEDIIEALCMFPYFKCWSEKSIKECCIMSSIKRFLPDTIILSNINGDQNNTFFVMDGTCTVLQKIELQMVTNHAVKTMFTIKTKINTSTDEEKSKILFVRIRDFSTGDCFGLGEDMTDRWVLSNTAVRCLVIPRDFLLQHNYYNIWPRIRQKISCSFPSTYQVHRSLIRQVQWYRFKHDLIEHLRKRKNINKNARLTNVPHYYRINIDIPTFLLYPHQ